MRDNFRFILALLFCLLVASSAPAQGGPRFEIVVPAAAHSAAITGRVYVIISPVKKDTLLDTFGAWDLQGPFYGQDVEHVAPGTPMVIDGESPGYPVESLKNFPAGDYYVQGLVNLYTEFHRADGHTLWLHMDQWEGQGFNISPGNLYSDVQLVHLDPAKGYTIRLQASHVIPPVVVPPDTQWVKRIRIKSELLSKFWGRPMYIGATILLPADYDEHPQQNYPVVYLQGHFSLSSPFGIQKDPPPLSPGAGVGDRETYEASVAWASPHFPRMIAVTFQHPTPYYDDSYAVNSPNDGPYGDALFEELIPYLESHFRMIREPWARVLTGGSTGGWESMALMLYHPSFFDGTYSGYPDQLDFRHYQLVNIYKDESAFLAPSSPLVPRLRPFQRSADGQQLLTVRQMSQLEEARGSHGRSGQQIAGWNSVWAPMGSDGYPRPLWDMKTGKIDPAVASYMRDNGYDLLAYLEKNWTKIGPLLTNKIHLEVGDMDGWYLNLGVYSFDDFFKKHPEAHATFVYGRPLAGHGWRPWTTTERLRLMAKHVKESAPAGTDVRGWYEP